MQGASTWPEARRAPPLGAPCASWAPMGPSTYSCTHTLSLPPTNPPSSSSTSSSSFCCDFRSPCSKLHSQTALGDCSLVCDSSIGPISFVLVLYSLQILLLRYLFLSLHVKFMRSQVVLMHDIGSRHCRE